MAGTANYEIEEADILRQVYYLLCVLYANKEIARTTDADDPIARLESRFRNKELSALILSVAIKLRVLEDQMRALPGDDATRVAYFRRRDAVDRRYRQMVFDELTLRQTCNKIIHATIFELYEQDGAEPHEYCPTRFADADDGVEVVEWEHYRTDWIRIGNEGEGWFYILDVSNFASAICAHFEKPELTSSAA